VTRRRLPSASESTCAARHVRLTGGTEARRVVLDSHIRGSRPRLPPRSSAGNYVSLTPPPCAARLRHRACPPRRRNRHRSVLLVPPTSAATCENPQNGLPAYASLPR
jgi:hypothetical protein